MSYRGTDLLTERMCGSRFISPMNADRLHSNLPLGVFLMIPYVILVGRPPCPLDRVRRAVSEWSEGGDKIGPRGREGEPLRDFDASGSDRLRVASLTQKGIAGVLYLELQFTLKLLFHTVSLR
jgi:hypothetical protein